MVGESAHDPKVRMEGMINDDTRWDVVGHIIVELLAERLECDELLLSDFLLCVESLALELLLVEFAVDDLRWDKAFAERLPTVF